MLFSLSHGQHVLAATGPTADRVAERALADRGTAEPLPLRAVAPDQLPVAEAAPARTLEMADAEDGAEARAMPQAADEMIEEAALARGEFHYYFPDAPSLPEDPAMPGWLDALALSMLEDPPDGTTTNSTIPPVFTYLGQFIDHDVTANTDRETDLSIIEGAITPLPRGTVEGGLSNLRDGSLELDSLYGDATGEHPFVAKLAGLMRHPQFRVKMRLNTPLPEAQGGGGRVPLPAAPDNATDLLRLGFLLRQGLVTEAELQALEPELRGVFLNGDGTPNMARAIIGDGRNDENLAVAQLHALFLRLHNKLADATGGRSFRRARRLTQWHYQWLVVNAYLRTLCDGDVLDQILELGAPRYTSFLDQHGANGPKMPMPIEFSVAAFRFGHSMVRGAYDHNRFFGEPVPGTAPVIQGGVANFNLLFGFTGNGRMRPAPGAPPSPTGRLPQNWVIEWERWVRKPTAAHPVRAARKIDTHLAPPLTEMVNEAAGVFKHLAQRNLRRGYRLNLPTAQGCIEAINASGYRQFPVLTPDQLLSGSESRAKAVRDGNFHYATPLWFYILKEAEILGEGEHLGPLGSHIVAETLVGLIVNDPDSYWNAEGGRWSPEKFRLADPINSMEAVARFCGMLA